MTRWGSLGSLLAFPCFSYSAGHQGVIVAGDRAFIFSCTHRHQGVASAGRVQHYAVRRSSIQVAALRVEAGELAGARDEPCLVRLTPP